jgi:methylmalonyl-CoA mutase
MSEIFSEFPQGGKQAWIEKVKSSNLSESELKALVSESEDGFSISAYYGAEDLKHLNQLGAEPGSYPYQNGFSTAIPELNQRILVQKFMESNQLIHEAIDAGVKSIELVGDTFGTDAEYAMLMKGINPENIELNFDFGESTVSFAMIWLSEVKEKNENRKGAMNIDPIRALIRTGNFEYPESDNFKIIQSVWNEYDRLLPAYRILHVNAADLHNSGASACSEAGFALSWALYYLDELSNLGFSYRDIVSKMEIHLAAGTNYFETIAKLRAFRMAWASVWDELEPGSEVAVPVINVECSNYYSTIYDAHNNLLRNTTEMMSAVIGGCNRITATPFDANFQMPTRDAYRWARNIYRIIQHESYLNKVIDPSAGSYFIENLTDKTADAIWAYFTECEKRGGFLAALKQKYPQAIIEQNHQKRTERFNAGNFILVGSNKYVNHAESMSGKFSKVYHQEYFKDEFLAMPLQQRRLAEKLEEKRLAAEAKMN